MTQTSHSEITRSSRRTPQVLHQHGIWRRPTSLGRRSKMQPSRRFSFTEQEIERSNTVKVYQEDSIIDTESLQSGEFVLPSPPMSVWSFAMSSSDGQLSEEFALCDPKNLRYHRDGGSTVTPSDHRRSIHSTNADYGFSVATSDSDSSFSMMDDDIMCSDLLSLLTDVPREIVVHKSLSQRFPVLRRLTHKLFRPSKLEL